MTKHNNTKQKRGKWSPDTYLGFENERTRPAHDLLARVPLTAPKSIYDLGCGPGNSTRTLGDRWPNAILTGIDNSPEMIRKAKTSAVNAVWLEADIDAWTPPTQADLIFSNAALHWIGDHEKKFTRLMSYLNPKGVFAVQMPRNFTSPSHTIIQQVVQNGPWANTLKNTRDFNPVARPEDYYDYLAPLSAQLDIWETEYIQLLHGEDPVYRWLEGAPLVPFLNALTDTYRDDFINQCKDKLKTAYRQRENGTTLFPFRRLFIIATAK